MVTERAPKHAAPLLLLVCLAGSLLLAGRALASAEAPPNLVELSLEELSDVRITSVSRREERLGDTAAALYVISGDAIQRGQRSRGAERGAPVRSGRHEPRV